jgi:membrane associated rhomboid family serine protease
MIPIRDSVKSSTVPVINYIIIAINALVFAYELSLGDQLDSFFRSFGLIPTAFFTALSTGDVLGVVFPVFTSMFMHGGLMHFFGNMWFLYIFGDNVQDSMGRSRYVVFYLLCGIAAALTQVFLNPDSQVPMIGASGAIAGVMGAYMVLYPRGKVLTLIPIFFFIQFVRVPAVVFLLIWIGLQTIQGVASLGMDMSGGVAFWAHIGGFVAGVVLIFLFRKPTSRNYYDLHHHF